MAELTPDKTGDSPIYMTRLVSTRVAEDGKPITITKLEEAQSVVAAIDPVETLDAGVYTKVYSEAVSDLLTNKVTETRPIPGNLIYSKRFNRFGGLDVTSKQDVAATTTPTNVTYSVQSLEQENSVTAKLIETVIATGTAISLIEKSDPQIPGSRAVVEYSLHLASETLTADSTLITYETMEFPENPLMRVWKKTTYTVPSYGSGDPLIEYRSQGFSFPALFISLVNDELGGTTRVSREAFSVNVPHRIETYFGTTLQTIDPYQIIQNDLLLYSMSARGLMNASTAEKTVNGVVLPSIPYDDSIPSLDTYVDDLIGEWILVDGSSTIWRAGIVKTEKIYVKFQ